MDSDPQNSCVSGASSDKLGRDLQAADAYRQEVVKTQTPGPFLAPKDSEPVNLNKP